MILEKILPDNGPKVEEVKKYIDKYKKDIIVVKVGGSVLLDSGLFNQLIEDISIINKLGLNIVVVHGGSKNIKEKLNKANLESKFINGLRVTNEKVIKIVEEALIELNKDIISKLRDNNCSGVSFTTNNNIINVESINKELGFVGNPTQVNSQALWIN